MKLWIGIAVLALAGCQGGARGTTVARSATEQLLLSSAARRALSRYDAEAWNGKRVFLEEGYTATLDRGFVVSFLRQRVAQAGGLLVNERAEAEVTLELRTASIGITDARYRIGVPELPVPLPGIADGGVLSPELSIGFDPKRGWAKLIVWACDADGVHLDRQTLWGHAIDSNFYDDVYPSLLDEVQGEGAQ